jgi:hypothetical protein
MTEKTMLLLPIIGMFLLTVGIALWMLKLRYRAVIKDGVSPAYFKLNRGAKLPDYVVRVTQHYENLFETPILFYIAILFVLTLDVIDTSYIVLSWLFFISRLMHAYVHTTINKLRIRKNVFIASGLILVLIWVKLAVDIVM